MKRKHLLLVGLFSSLIVSKAQAQSLATARAHYSAVNKVLPSCKIVKMDLSGYSTEGGVLTAYLKKGQPQKLVARYYGETGRATEEYYFWQGKLFFELRTDEDYEIPVPGPGTPGRITQTQQRFYFKDGKLVRWLSDGNKPNDLKTTAALKAEMDIVKQARELLSKVRSKK